MKWGFIPDRVGKNRQGGSGILIETFAKHPFLPNFYVRLKF
jgi:hypothetical protein